jgi:hypothetical protein
VLVLGSPHLLTHLDGTIVGRTVGHRSYLARNSNLNSSAIYSTCICIAITAAQRRSNLQPNNPPAIPNHSPQSTNKENIALKFNGHALHSSNSTPCLDHQHFSITQHHHHYADTNGDPPRLNPNQQQPHPLPPRSPHALNRRPPVRRRDLRARSRQPAHRRRHHNRNGANQPESSTEFVRRAFA